MNFSLYETDYITTNGNPCSLIWSIMSFIALLLNWAFHLEEIRTETWKGCVNAIPALCPHPISSKELFPRDESINSTIQFTRLLLDLLKSYCMTHVLIFKRSESSKCIHNKLLSLFWNMSRAITCYYARGCSILFEKSPRGRRGPTSPKESGIRRCEDSRDDTDAATRTRDFSSSSQQCT